MNGNDIFLLLVLNNVKFKFLKTKSCLNKTYFKATDLFCDLHHMNKEDIDHFFDLTAFLKRRRTRRPQIRVH